MKFKITNDSKGLAVWPDISLEKKVREGRIDIVGRPYAEYVDPQCEVRGGMDLYDLLRLLVGDDGVHLVLEKGPVELLVEVQEVKWRS